MNRFITLGERPNLPLLRHVRSKPLTLMPKKYTVTPGDPIVGHVTTPTYRVHEVGDEVWMYTAVWIISGKPSCVYCQGPLQAMLSSCPHARAVKRYLDRDKPKPLPKQVEPAPVTRKFEWDVPLPPGESWLSRTEDNKRVWELKAALLVYENEHTLLRTENRELQEKNKELKSINRGLHGQIP